MIAVGLKMDAKNRKIMSGKRKVLVPKLRWFAHFFNFDQFLYGTGKNVYINLLFEQMNKWNLQ